MGSFLTFYIIFAITTALAACVILLAPCLKEIKDAQPMNSVVTMSLTTYAVFFCLCLLLAPIVLLALIFENPNRTFKTAFVKEILK